MARRNVALASEGSVATALTTFAPAEDFPPSGAIQGNRTTAGWGTPAGGWASNGIGPTPLPTWFQVDFPALMAIDEIDVITYGSATEPVLNVTTDNVIASGLRNYTVAYWDGTAFQTVATVTANLYCWRQFTFATVATLKIRITVSLTADNTARLLGVEAYGDSVNVTEGVGTATGTATVLGVGGYRTTGEKRSGFGSQKPSRRRHR